MKYRRYPYGYEMKNGKVIICEAEAKTVKNIFASYISGSNLKAIAEKLKNQGVQYMLGKTNWDKCRIKRILEDERYLGTDIYEQIIDKSTFDNANEIKNGRRKQAIIEENTNRKLFAEYAHCSCCGSKMYYMRDNCHRNNEIWTCKNPDCKAKTFTQMDFIEKTITEKLNELIANLDLCDVPEEKSEPSAELRKAENKLERLLSGIDTDKEEAQRRIFECASLKYKEISSVKHITNRMKADFEKSGLLSKFSEDLFRKTVKQIIIVSDDEIKIMFKNSKEI